MSGSAIIGRVLPNLLADRFGAFNVGVPVIFLMSVLIFVMFGVTNSASAVVFAVLYGMAFGGCSFSPFWAFSGLLTGILQSFQSFPCMHLCAFPSRSIPERLGRRTTPSAPAPI